MTALDRKAPSRPQRVSSLVIFIKISTFFQYRSK